MNKGVIYARVSTERQRELHTIASQISILPEIIKQKGYVQVFDPYVDDGISGETIEDRPAMTKLLEDAEQGLFDAVFVIDIDRLTRAKKSIDWEIIKDVFRKNNVLLVTPSQEYNFEDEDQEFISDIFSRISAYEKKKILRRMLRGKREKAKQGVFFGGKAPYGYTWHEDSKQYEIVEEEAKVVSSIFNLCIEGSSIVKIQEHLNDFGIPTPVDAKGYNHKRKSKKWAKSTVRRILTNSMYAGEFIRWQNKRYDKNVLSLRPKEEWITAESPAIISKDVFDLAKSALEGRKALSTRNSKREYLLSGLIYCESCNCKMSGECYTNRYYICANGRRKHLDKDCPSRSIKGEYIEDAVWTEISRLLKNPSLLKQSIIQSEKTSSTKNNFNELSGMLKEKETEEERLLDLYQLGKVDINKLNARIEKLNSEKGVIRKNIGELKDRNKIDNSLKTINELKFELEADIDSFEFEQKRKVLKILLWGMPGVGVFLKPDYTVEIRGLVDFTKFNDISNLDDCVGIKNTTYL